jgi:hypothetical protein
MIKHRIATILAAGVIVSGVGAALAVADDSPSGSTACPTTLTAPATAPQSQMGMDEQGATNDVNDAADQVEMEAVNQGADDSSGDQQGSNDQSEEPDDNCQDGGDN